MTDVELYTDGSCSGNPGPGGWGSIIKYKGAEKILSGGEPETTNNRMELTAVIKGLEALTRPCTVSVYSDSKYFCDAFAKDWISGWKKRGWRRSAGELLNSDLWKRLDELGQIHKIIPIWIKGHAGHPENERCDRLAVEQTEKFASGRLR